MNVSTAPSPLPSVRPATGGARLRQTLELWWQFTWRTIELRHKGSTLGLAWAALHPLLMTAIYVFVFGFVFGGRFGATPEESRIDYALALLIGLSILHLLSEVMGTSAPLIPNHANLVKKVVFPLEIIPAAQVAAAVVHFGITLALVLAGIAFLGPGLSSGLLWLPVLLLPLIALALGLAWFIAAFAVFFRDIGNIALIVATALLFMSAVFYSPEQIPPAAWAWLRFNPLLHAIDQARRALLWDLPVSLPALGYLYACGGLAAGLGLLVFRKLKRGFADVL